MEQEDLAAEGGAAARGAHDAAEGDACVDQVEEAIRRAEELMARDFEMLRDSDLGTAAAGNGDGHRDATEAGETETAERLLVRQSNRYKDPVAREELISKLLQERENTLTARDEMLELEERIEVRAIEQERHQRHAEQERERQREALRREQQARRPGTPGSRRPGSAAGAMARPGSAQARRRPMSAGRGRPSGREPRPGTAGPAARRQRRLGEAGPGQPLTALENTEGRRPFHRKSLDQVKRQVEMERAKDCTFRPKINNKHPTQQQEPSEDRLLRLAKPKSVYWQKQEQRRREMEEAEVSTTCPFKPDITAAVALLEQGDLGPDYEGWQQRVKEAYRNHVPVEKRLHLDANQRWEAREKARRELEEAELQAQPFRPKVNVVSEEIAKQIDYEPIERRAPRVRREKQERMAKRKLELELGNRDLTFKPAISENSQRIAQNAAIRRGKVPAKDVVQRLLSSANDVEGKRRQRQQAWAEQQENECRFKPAVSRNSSRLLAANQLYGKNVDFLTRQARLEEERRLREQRKRAEVHDMTGVATFKPKTDPNRDRLLVRGLPERLAETEDQRITRLSQKDAVRREQLQESIREHHYAQYQFKPSISRISREIVRETHKSGDALYEDLHRNERGRQFRRAVQTQVEEESLKDCTFKPKTLARENARASNFIRSSRRGSRETLRVIEEERQRRERRLREQQREIEYEEMRGCTFTPQVNGQSPAPTAKGPVVVRGLGRYLELRELAKRQTEEQREREAKVFLEDASRIRPEPYTIPQPFNLSETSEAVVSRRRRRGSLPAGCTFKPRTKAAANREQVQRILASQ